MFTHLARIHFPLLTALFLTASLTGQEPTAKEGESKPDASANPQPAASAQQAEPAKPAAEESSAKDASRSKRLEEIERLLRELLKEIRSAVADGKSLTDTLRQYPEVFTPLHTAMIQAGERAAFMEEVLRSLSGFLERFEELRSKVMGALIYPAMLTALGTFVMLAALIFFEIGRAHV